MSSKSDNIALAVGAVITAGLLSIPFWVTSGDKSNSAASSSSSTTAVQPVKKTPEETFKDDMDDVFGQAINPGKSPVRDFFDWRTFTPGIAQTGYEICAYLQNRTREQAADEFKLALPIGYPTDSQALKFVDLAIEDLCPERGAAPTK